MSEPLKLDAFTWNRDTKVFLFFLEAEIDSLNRTPPFDETFLIILLSHLHKVFSIKAKISYFITYSKLREF